MEEVSTQYLNVVYECKQEMACNDITKKEKEIIMGKVAMKVVIPVFISCKRLNYCLF